MSTINFKRVTLYIDAGDYELIKKYLTHNGISISGWFRRRIDQYLREKGLKKIK